jgi:hypothetical protein
LDNTEFDIGVFRTSNFTLKLRNEHGLYSDVGAPESIFRYKRSDTQIKVTFQDGPAPICGLFKADGSARLAEELTVFTGLLNDEGLSQSLEDQAVSFTVLGRESRFQRTIVPFGTIHDGDLLSTVIFACLNQSNITNVLTVSPGNITCGIDQQIDSIASLQNKTVQEGLNKLLMASNSVLYINDDSVIVAPRTPTADVKHHFYGQASVLGPENIQSIKNIKSGAAKTYNYLSWKGVAQVQQDASSIQKFDIRKKEIEFDFLTDATKRQNVLASLLAEFKIPKQEFEAFAPLNYRTIAIGLLDRVDFDYPTVPIPGEYPWPVCGSVACGDFYLPDVLYSFTLDQTSPYKVMGRTIDHKSGLMKFKVREI